MGQTTQNLYRNIHSLNMKAQKSSNVKAFTKVNVKECKRIISSGEATLRNDLNPDGDNGFDDYYLLKDGRLLLCLKFEPSGVIYPSYEALLNVIEKGERKWKNRFPGKRMNEAAEPIEFFHINMAKFDEEVANAPFRLAEKFRLKSTMLDYSDQSFDLLSKHINKRINELPRDEVFDEIGNELMLYFGEAIRERVKGKWIYSLNPHGRLQTLKIIDGLNPQKTYLPYSMLLDEFFEHTNPVNLKADLLAELNKFMFVKDDYLKSLEIANKPVAIIPVQIGENEVKKLISEGKAVLMRSIAETETLRCYNLDDGRFLLYDIHHKLGNIYSSYYEFLHQ